MRDRGAAVHRSGWSRTSALLQKTCSATQRAQQVVHRVATRLSPAAVENATGGWRMFAQTDETSVVARGWVIYPQGCGVVIHMGCG